MSRPELCGIRAVVQFFRQSAERCAAPPTSPFMGLLIDPLAVKAQARLPRRKLVCHAVRQVVAVLLVFSCEANQSVAAPKYLQETP